MSDTPTLDLHDADDGLSTDERAHIADTMSAQWEDTGGGANKCVDCCLVASCDSCGPCDVHDETTEAESAREWMRNNT